MSYFLRIVKYAEASGDQATCPGAEVVNEILFIIKGLSSCDGLHPLLPLVFFSLLICLSLLGND